MMKHITQPTNCLLQWQENLAPSIWDGILTTMQGHPLQSALWGQARNIVDNIHDSRWVAYKNTLPSYLVRFEHRIIFRYIKIAWVPKGPIVANPSDALILHQAFLSQLKKAGFWLCIMNPWQEMAVNSQKDPLYTIWIDLNNKQELWAKLTKQVRYDIKRAQNLDIVIKQSKSLQDVSDFYQLCKAISISKNFHFNISLARMIRLLQCSHTDIESHLFLAYYNNQLCSGAFIIRCGVNIHYMWGAVNRDFAKLNSGVALQWYIIEWALNQNCKMYDMEGVDPATNPGTYLFKKKMGGKMIALSGYKIYPLTLLTSIGWQCFLLGKYLSKLVRKNNQNCKLL